jgi:hypothetical protein
MLRLVRLLLVQATQLFRSRHDLLLENLALRQQLTVLKQRHPLPRFASSDLAIQSAVSSQPSVAIGHPPFQSKILTKAVPDIQTKAFFVPGWQFGEAQVSQNASNDLLELFLAKLTIQRMYRARRAEDFSRKVLISQSDLTGQLRMDDGRHERTVFP